MAFDEQHAVNMLATILHLSSGGSVGSPSTSAPDPAHQLGQQYLNDATQQASGDSTTSSTTATIPGTQAALDASDSSMIDPVPAGTGVSQPYGGGTGHPGIDLSVPVGTSLLAAQSGTVTVASNEDPNGYGLEVEIETPDGHHIRYGHLSATNLKVGQTVKAGQPIGQSGGDPADPNHGNSGGAHLHFEVRGPDGATVDPTPWLAGGHAIVDAAPATVTATTSIASPDQQMGAAVSNILDVAAGKSASHSTEMKTTTTTSGGAQAAAPGQPSDSGNFAADILAGIGAPNTSENVRFIEAWMRAEGGADHNNPLNTTQGAPGATDFNSVGVKSYTSYAQGVQATIQTLLNGMYGNILDALKQGTSAKAAADALANSPWGTGALVQQILGGS